MVKMTKSKLKGLMNEHCVLECELTDVIRFVRDLLECKAE
jgi:hypothetical protein